MDCIEAKFTDLQHQLCSNEDATKYPLMVSDGQGSCNRSYDLMLSQYLSEEQVLLKLERNRRSD